MAHTVIVRTPPLNRLHNSYHKTVNIAPLGRISVCSNAALSSAQSAASPVQTLATRRSEANKIPSAMATVLTTRFAAIRAIFSPSPRDLARDYGHCDYDISHNLNAQYVYQLPVRVRSHSLGYALSGWQISGTAFWHSGVPFSVSTPYSANGNGRITNSSRCHGSQREYTPTGPAK